MNTAAFASRTSLFWTIVAGLVIASGAFTHRYFSESFPLISLSISMDRALAVEKAAQISVQQGWLPQEPRSAVEFKDDKRLQFFVELECGGKKAFAQLLESKLYEPYQWHVRRFQEKITHETWIQFTPEGVPYGFTLKLPETELRRSLTSQEARELAHAVAQEWGISFEQYRELESSKKQKPCGRLDHTFTYERTDAQLGTEGRYRLALEVSGDRVTQVQRFVFIPETFTRRFDEMRSSNNTIYTLGTVVVRLLYQLVGCLIAGFFFFRRRYLFLRPALYWGALFGILTTLATLNELPLAWMSYDTATSASSFLIQFLISATLAGARTFCICTGLLSICMGWDQLAFPSHLAFWKSWSATTGSSRAVLGRTLAGYAYAAILLGMQVVTYLILTKKFHWWFPADTLINPNILATYLPWLSPLSLASQAGMLEELLFRAFPLAACALVGRRFGREKTAVCAGLILQALIFGACHANYIQMPGYFRVVEAFVPSLLFGLLYLLYGLLPGVVAHVLYDFFLLSIPIFATDSSHILISKAMIGLLFFLPLCIVLLRRRQRGSWYTLSEDDYNRAALPGSDTSPQKAPYTRPEPVMDSTLAPWTATVCVASGILGALLWLWGTPHTADTAPLLVTKETALSLAQDAFIQEQVPTPPGFVWEPWARVVSKHTSADTFVWRAEGVEKYRELQNSYLVPPLWTVRYLSFSGSLIDRAEEFTAAIGPEETMVGTTLVLPESAAGASLAEGEARGIALEAIKDKWNISPIRLKEVAASPQERPCRRDWTFIFQDKEIPFTTEGQARIGVVISGERVTDMARFVFTPEAWLRKEQQTNLYREMFDLFVHLVKATLLFIALFILQRRLLQRFSLGRLLWWTAALIPLALLAYFNELEQQLSGHLVSSQPYYSQLFAAVASSLSRVVIVTTLFSLLAAVAKDLIITKARGSVALLAIGAGLCIRGARQAFVYFTNDTFLPSSPSYGELGASSPFFSLASSMFTETLSTIVLYLLCMSAFTTIYQRSERKKLWGMLFFIVAVITSCHPLYFTHLSTIILFALMRGLLLTIFYFLLIRYDQRAVIMMVSTQWACLVLEEGVLQAYPHALLSACVVAGGTMLMSYYWFSRIASTSQKND